MYNKLLPLEGNNTVAQPISSYRPNSSVHFDRLLKVVTNLIKNIAFYWSGNADEFRCASADYSRTGRQSPLKRREPLRLCLHLHTLHLDPATPSGRGVLPHILEDRLRSHRRSHRHCVADHTGTVYVYFWCYCFTRMLKQLFIYNWGHGNGCTNW